MINIAIVDDDEQILQQLKSYVCRYFADRPDSYTLHPFHDGIALVTGYRPIWHIIFLDIEMNGLDGMATAKKIREIDSHVVIVFITNLAKYAVRGYEVNALSFIIKPLKFGQFNVAMKKAEAVIKRRNDSSIVLNMNGDIRVLRTEEICYVEAYDHWLIYYTEDASYKCRGAMVKLMEQVPADSFQLCHRCYLVNLRYVSALSGNVLNIGPYSLTVSRSRRTEFVHALTEYFGRKY